MTDQCHGVGWGNLSLFYVDQPLDRTNTDVLVCPVINWCVRCIRSTQVNIDAESRGDSTCLIFRLRLLLSTNSMDAQETHETRETASHARQVVILDLCTKFGKVQVHGWNTSTVRCRAVLHPMRQTRMADLDSACYQTRTRVICVQMPIFPV